MNVTRWLGLLLLLPLLLAAQELPQARSAQVYWEPLPAGWKAWYIAGQDSQPIVGEAAELRAGRHIVLNSGGPDIGRIVIEIRLSDRDIRTLDQFAGEFAGHGLASVYRYEETRLAGVDAFHASPDTALKRYQDWLLLLDLPGGRPWIAMQATCARSPGKPGYETCEQRAAEQAQILASLSFDRPPAKHWSVRIEVPSDLKPGDELFPTAVIVDDQGRAPSGEVTLIWRFDGQKAKSQVWDGRPLRIEVDASVDGRGLAVTLQLPRWDPTAPPPPRTPPAAPPPQSPPPGLQGPGELPGPRNATEGLTGTLGPAALGLLGALLSGLLKAPPTGPRRPPQAPPKPRRARRVGDGAGDGESPESGTPVATGGGRDPESGPDDAKPPGRKPDAGRRRERAGDSPHPDDPGAHVRERLEQLRRTAQRGGRSELGAAIDQAIARSFDADGKLDASAWKDAQKDLWAAHDRMWKVQGPNSPLWDLAASGAGAVGKGIVSGLGAAGGLVSGLEQLGIGAIKGAAAIGDAIIHLPTFARGASETISRWADRNAPTEKRIVEEGLRSGRLGDALIGVAMGGVKAGIAAGESVGGFIKREILPWEEIESLASSQSSLEEKLWAVPAAAAKIAGLMAMTQRPGAQPSTRWGQAIQDTLDRRAAAAAAAAESAAAPSGASTLRAPAPAPVAPAAPATRRPDLKRLWQQGADGSEVRPVTGDVPRVSGHDAVLGEQSIESMRRAEQFRFFKVDRRGVQLLEAGAGVEDRCDVLLPRKPLAEISPRDIVVRTDDPVRARLMRDQMWRHIRRIVDG
ncbi:MAG: hypothetical protein JNL89_16470 [Rhodanobacteraceae bacterium]|nr:hypothetical protein [Rhodanobacteraceae bacterium]